MDELVEASFGGAQELSLTLARPPIAAERALLSDAGLRPDDERPAHWAGSLSGGLESVSALGARLDRAGLQVEELRVREPGLRGVFFRLTGREMAT